LSTLTSARTCTTRHNEGYDGVPSEFLTSFLPIEPGAANVKRPIVKILGDQDKAFDGKTLIFLEVPIVGYISFFVGYIATVTPASRLSIEAEFYQWQVGRISAQDPASQLTAALSCVHALSVGVELKGTETVIAQVSSIVTKLRGQLPMHLVHLLDTIELYVDTGTGITPNAREDKVSPSSSSTKTRVDPRPRYAALGTRTNEQRLETKAITHKRSRSPSCHRHASQSLDERSTSKRLLANARSPSPQRPDHRRSRRYANGSERYYHSGSVRSRSPHRSRLHEDTYRRSALSPQARDGQDQDMHINSSFHCSSPSLSPVSLKSPRQDSSHFESDGHASREQRNKSRTRSRSHSPPSDHYSAGDRPRKDHRDARERRAGYGSRHPRSRSPSHNYHRRDYADGSRAARVTRDREHRDKGRHR
jgi:hypothetical protein